MDGIVYPLEEQDDFHHAKQNPLNAVIVNEYHNGDIIPQHSDDVKLSSIGTVDDLRSGTVVTLTLNASGVFYIVPSKAIRKRLGLKHSKHDSSIAGRVAVLVHPGDIVVMSGGPQRNHEHGTKAIHEWKGLHESNWRCIDFHDDDIRMVDPKKNIRYSLAL